MSILIGIFVSGKSLEVSIYEQTTGGFWQMDEYDDKLDQIILQWKLFFEEELIKIYVVGNEISNIDFILIDDPLVHLLKMSDIDFTCYLQIKLTPETKIAWFEDNNSITLYEYANTRNGFLEYKLVKCFEARLDLENHVQLMLQFFECDLNQLHFFNLDYSRLEMIKKENNDFSSYTLFRRLSNSQSAIIYGRYLLNDNVQSLIKLPENFLLDDIEQNTLNFKVNKVIPSHWAIQTYQSQTRLMGIDLGASRTVVCVSRNGRAELVKIDREYSMPSVISFVENEPIIGNVAKRHLAKNSGLVLFDLKYLRNAKRRLDGHWVPDEYWWPFGHCIEAKKSSFVFQSKGVFKRYSTVEIYQILLQKLKQEASEYQSDLNEGKDVNQAVITVPDFDNKLMLGNIYAAAELLGLKILDVITETEADLLYFLSKEEFSRGETVAVVDIGGGTGFIEKFSFEEGFHEKRNLSLSGRMINEYLELAVEDLLDIYDKSKVFRQLPAFNFEQKIEIEKMKEEFSFEEKLLLPSVIVEKEDVPVTRNWFEKKVLDRIICEKAWAVERTLKDEKYSSNISKVFLVGGTCRIPYIQKLFKSIFGEEKVVIPNNLQEITATGALIHGLKVLNGEIEPVFQRNGIKKQVDLNEGVNEHMDKKPEVDSLVKTENVPSNVSVTKNKNASIVGIELLALDKRFDDGHKPQNENLFE